MMALGAELGLDLDLSRVPADPGVLRDDRVLFSESCGRFLATVPPSHQEDFEEQFRNLPWGLLGRVVEEPVLRVRGRSGGILFEEPLAELRRAWMVPDG